MTAELVRTVTQDGLFLDGAFYRPSEHAANGRPVDAMLLVHGTGSNFYAPGLLDAFALQAVTAGLPTLRINTRGHDGVASIPGEQGSRLGGAAYETISECRFDLTAWLDWLGDQGFSRVGLVGHSMGAVKAIYAMAQTPHAAVRCLIALSPPRFCHERLLSHSPDGTFATDYRRAEQLVADDRADELIQVRQPLPHLATAAGFIAKYGPHDEYDVLRHLPKLAIPTLVVIGTESAATSAAFAGLPEDLEQLAERHAQLTVSIVQGANTGYSTCPQLPFDLTAEWMRDLP